MESRLRHLVHVFARQPEDGATAVEYALMVGFIALAVIGTVTLIGGSLGGIFTELADFFASA